MIYFTSDLHFHHNKEFIYKPRGFDTIYQMNDAIINNWNSIIQPDDDVYVLGDLMLNNNDEGLKLIKNLTGRLHIILGNHDTNIRITLYKSCENVVEVTYATMLHINGYHFFLTHFPSITSNLEKENIKQCTINLYGHTHQKNNFFNDMPFMYHVGVDSHNCTPVSIDQIIVDINKQVQDCINCL